MSEALDTAERKRADACQPTQAASGALAPLDSIALSRWQALAGRAIEPNAYFLPAWERAVNASSPGRTGARVLAADHDGQTIGLLPVTSAWRAYGLPLPALVTADPYGTLATPLLDRDTAEDAAAALIAQARASGARALVLRDMALEGPAFAALTHALARDGLNPRILRRYERAMLAATGDGETVLRAALGGKKLKELRRQRSRLAERHGAVTFTAVTAPDETAAALETFLALEASGWKGTRGTALAQIAGDAAFIRRAVREMAARGACEIVTLHAGDAALAAGIVLRHLDRAFFFKIGVDERFAAYSPGVQLTLDLTRHLCADPAIATADSTAAPGHPMIGPIWRDRLALGDVVLPLHAQDATAAALGLALRLRDRARDALRALRR